MRLGGVPEHFNIPILRALAALGDEETTWTSVKGGTGAMMQLLQRGELDVVFALTEGILAALVNAEDDGVRGCGRREARRAISAVHGGGVVVRRW